MEVLTKDQLWRYMLRPEPTRSRHAGGFLFLAAVHRLRLIEILVIAAGVVTLAIITPIVYRLAGWWGIAGLVVWTAVCTLVAVAIMIGKREPPRR